MFKRPWLAPLLVTTALLTGVATPAVAAHLITSKDVKNGSLSEADLNKAVRAKLNRPMPAAGVSGAPGADGVDGLDGSPGLPGAQGEDGVPGASGASGTDGLDGRDGLTGQTGQNGLNGLNGRDGVSDHQIRSGQRTRLVDAGVHTLGTGCQAGAAPVGGGFRRYTGEATAVSSYPEGDSWIVEFSTSGDSEVAVYVICIKAS